MALDQDDGIQKKMIRFRLCTESRWIRGQVTTTQRRLVDLLNVARRQSFLAEKVLVQSRLDGQGKGEEFDYAYINTWPILFAVPVEEVGTSLQPREPSLWIRKRPERLRFAIGPYEITGDVHLIEGAKLSGSLFEGRERFVPVTRAVIRHIDDPSFVEEQEVVCVNVERIDYFMGVAPSS